MTGKGVHRQHMRLNETMYAASEEQGGLEVGPQHALIFRAYRIIDMT
jgi:hypothetical protein